MKPRPSTKAGNTRRARETPASEQPTGLDTPVVRSRFAFRLPELEAVPPLAEQDGPPGQLFYNFLAILSDIAHEVAEMAEPGLLAFDVEVAFLNAMPGEIPLDEAGPLGGLLRGKLPAVIREAKPEPQTIIDESLSRKRVKIAAIFFNGSNVYYKINDISNSILYKEDINNGQRGHGGPALVTDDGYIQLTRQLEERNHSFRQQLATDLAPALNAHIHAMPQETLDQKKELARWVNEEVQRFGLAVQCPNTGLPAKLRGVTGSNHWPDTGRYCCEVYREGKQKKTAYWDTAPELTLIDATPHKDTEVAWQQAVGPMTSRSGRSRK